MEQACTYSSVRRTFTADPSSRSIRYECVRLSRRLGRSVFRDSCSSSALPIVGIRFVSQPFGITVPSGVSSLGKEGRRLLSWSPHPQLEKNKCNGSLPEEINSGAPRSEALQHDSPSQSVSERTSLPVRENVYTIPNLVTASRILACPILGWSILEGDFRTATLLLAYAGISDWVLVLVALDGINPLILRCIVRWICCAQIQHAYRTRDHTRPSCRQNTHDYPRRHTCHQRSASRYEFW